MSRRCGTHGIKICMTGFFQPLQADFGRNGAPELKEGALRDEPKNGHGHVRAVPYCHHWRSLKELAAKKRGGLCC